MLKNKKKNKNKSLSKIALITEIRILKKNVYELQYQLIQAQKKINELITRDKDES